LADEPASRRSNLKATDSGRAAPAAGGGSGWQEFSLARAVFEIVIVAIGVLLALVVDQARQ